MPNVKTTISLDREIYEEMERLGHKKKISRSQLFAEAARDLVKRERDAEITARLNEVYSEPYDPEQERAELEAMFRLYRETLDTDK